MKGIYIITVLFFCTFTKATGEETDKPFYIKGTITNIESAKGWIHKVYLLKMNTIDDFTSGSINMIVDSADIKPNGTFSFHNDKVIENNTFYRLNVIKDENNGNGAALYMTGSNENFIFLFLQKSSQIEFTTEIDRFDDAFTAIQSDAANEAIRKLYAVRRSMLIQLDRLVPLMRTPGISPDSLKSIRGTIQRMFITNAKQIETFADTVSNSYLSILAAAFTDPDDSFFVSKMNKRYSKQIPSSKYAVQYQVALNDHFLRSLSKGNIAPEIILPDAKGNIVKLSDFKGNYVLIDFWASWCNPCKAEIKETVKPLLNKYKSKNFTVFSISLDTDKDKWMAALLTVGLDCKQVNAVLGFASQVAIEYHISGLPATYFIDPEGKILVRGLRGNDLQQYVDTLLGGK